MNKLLRRSLAGVLIGALVAGNSIFVSAAEKVTTTYNKVEEIQDWGAATTKVIVDLKEEIKKTNISTDTFSVSVKRTDSRKTDSPVLEEGSRKVTKAYVSDSKGNQADSGSFVTLELEIGPTLSIGSPLNYYNKANVWIDCDYTITQKKDIKSGDVTISGLETTTLNERMVPIVEDFGTGSTTYNDPKYGEITLTYADYKPQSTTSTKKPLVIWLHGGGEGGTDATIPLSANKSVNFATEPIQKIFGGAYVLVPQTPTKWMDDGVNKEGVRVTETIYTGSLMNLIDEYVKANDGIDTNRIYIGGCSNGGFMTLKMILAYPNYFAAAYPICEGLLDSAVTEEDIDTMKDMNIWFVTAATDTTLPAPQFTLPTYDRLIKAGAKNVHLSYFVNVVDTTGLYKDADGSAHEYDGHWTWTYVYNNLVSNKINGKDVNLLNWLAAQKKA